MYLRAFQIATGSALLDKFAFSTSAVNSIFVIA